MCTVSIIPLPQGLRLAINRDELRTRPRALRPAIVTLDSGVCAAWPTDAQAGGTWVAANDLGVVFALLNGNPRPMPPMPPDSALASRGLIIPMLVDSERAMSASRRLESLDLSRYAPFRLVAADGSSIIDAFWDRRRLRTQRRPMSPVSFASSGLGDAKVASRVTLFDELLARKGATASMQDEFHQHRWPGRPEISVLMSRPEARTVSLTRVESRVEGVVMDYTDDAGSVRASLATREGAGARGEPLAQRLSC